MRKAKKSESKPVQNAEEAVTPVLLARLAAKIAPALCLNEPRQAIEAAARLIQCAREWLPMPDAEDEEPSLADEKAQLKALAKHADKYGFKLAGGTSRLRTPSPCKRKIVSGKENAERGLIKLKRHLPQRFAGRS
jgi:hypothetical protein